MRLMFEVRGDDRARGFMRKKGRDNMKKLETKSCEEIMSTAYKPLAYCVDGLLTQGLYLLAGAPKAGKSWLALDICLSVAKGEDVLKHQTHIGTALYLCLEDSYHRIQNRLYELTDEPTENLYFAIMSESLGNGLKLQIEKFKSEHSDLKLVVIDTLQMVRNEKDCGYGADYKELSVLKSLADKLAITILLVHHTRKCYDSDPFNMISGSTGISGCADGSMVLVETFRGSRKGTLYCVGRDIGNAEIAVGFDETVMKWIVSDEPPPQKSHDNIFLSAVYLFIRKRFYFVGSATELIDELKSITDEEFFPNRVTRDLVQNGYELSKYGIEFQYKRTHSGRIIHLDYYSERDGSDGKNDDKVTVTQRCLETSQTSIQR